METILTGVRTNGELTLGNFLGAIRPMAELAKKYHKTHKINVFVPDLHTIIADVQGDLQANIIRSLKYYLAAGLPIHDNILVYRQSYVPAHSELTWILNCTATMGETSRMIQYKEKSDGGKETANVGIFDYPVLMAADILLYSAKYVPVGEDQFQHLELTRDLALRFNHRAGKEIFLPPSITSEQAEFMGLSSGLRIRDLQNPEKKMDKSSPNANSKIMLSDEPAVASKKIMSATTDNLAKIDYDMFNQPGISNLLQILSLLTDTTLENVTAVWAGEDSYGAFKQNVATVVSDFLTDFQAKYNSIDDKTVLDLLEKGEKRANEIAKRKLLEAQKAVGLR
ncbi:tryptophan--tRNA ligase [Candidatus Saccharibacteria bacterium]|nr:tryptophan--tRNA ligase [Candidatus Saccharibacteria bacterium]